MSEAIWSDVEHYIGKSIVGEDAILAEALAASDAAGLPAISVTANQGKLLQILARSIAARMILEIGTLGGYSTIWLARALPPEGRLVSLEASEKHAEVARANIDKAGLSDRVEVRVGRALESLPRLAAEGIGPFDLVFIDADKESNPEYFQWALSLSRRGGLIIVDNVVRDGQVIDGRSCDPDVMGIRRLYEMMGREARVIVTAMQTVGSKGYDGFAIALVRDV